MIMLDFDKVPNGWEVTDFWPTGDDGSEGVVLSFGPPADSEEEDGEI